MNTYPLSHEYALLITPDVAATILIHDFHKNADTTPEIPETILTALDAGRTPYEIATDPAFKNLIRENDFDNVSDAHDVLQSDDLDGTVYCSEFQGEANTPEGFGEGARIAMNYDDDFIAMLVPEKQPSLFEAAYDDYADLLDEYKRRLEDYVGPGFPYARFIVNVFGTYFC